MKRAVVATLSRIAVGAYALVGDAARILSASRRNA